MPRQRRAPANRGALPPSRARVAEQPNRKACREQRTRAGGGGAGATRAGGLTCPIHRRRPAAAVQRVRRREPPGEERARGPRRPALPLPPAPFPPAQATPGPPRPLPAQRKRRASAGAAGRWAGQARAGYLLRVRASWPQGGGGRGAAEP